MNTYRYKIKSAIACKNCIHAEDFLKTEIYCTVNSTYNDIYDSCFEFQFKKNQIKLNSLQLNSLTLNCLGVPNNIKINDNNMNAKTVNANLQAILRSKARKGKINISGNKFNLMSYWLKFRLWLRGWKVQLRTKKYKSEIIFTHIWVENFGWENTVFLPKDFNKVNFYLTNHRGEKIFKAYQNNGKFRILKGYYKKQTK